MSEVASRSAAAKVVRVLSTLAGAAMIGVGLFYFLLRYVAHGD